MYAIFLVAIPHFKIVYCHPFYGMTSEYLLCIFFMQYLTGSDFHSAAWGRFSGPPLSPEGVRLPVVRTIGNSSAIGDRP